MILNNGGHLSCCLIYNAINQRNCKALLNTIVFAICFVKLYYFYT